MRCGEPHAGDSVGHFDFTSSGVSCARCAEDAAGPGQRVSLVLSQGTVTVPLEGLVDLEQERRRLSKELEQIKVNRQRLSARLKDEKFLAKAPEEVVERERERLSGMDDRRARVVETLSRLG